MLFSVVLLRTMYACPQCLPSDIVPIRSWTRTLRPPGIRHRHLPYHTIPYHTIPYHTTFSPTNEASPTSDNNYSTIPPPYPPSLVTQHWCRVPSVHGTYYPVLAWSIQLLAYAMPSVPVPPIILLTDMVARCRLLAAHGARSCLSVRTQPLMATGAPSQTSTIPYHTRRLVNNVKLFNNHSGLRGLPRFTEGIHWATGLSLTTPFTEGCAGANNKASPPGRHQEQASKQRCTLSPTTFSSVQFSSVQPTTFSSRSCCYLPAVGPGGLRWDFFFFGWDSWLIGLRFVFGA